MEEPDLFDHIKRYYKYVLFFSAIIFILFFPMVLYKFLFSLPSPSIILPNDVATIVSAYMTLIGGGFTLIAVFLTIKHQNKITSETNRLNVLPFLSFKFVKDQPIINNDEAALAILLPKVVPKEGIKAIALLQIEIKNVGIGVAIAPSLKKSIVRNEPTTTFYAAYESGFLLHVSDTFHKTIEVFTYEDIGSRLYMTFGFYDVLGNFYFQDILLYVDYDYDSDPYGEMHPENLKLQFSKVNAPVLSSKFLPFPTTNKVNAIIRSWFKKAKEKWGNLKSNQKNKS